MVTQWRYAIFVPHHKFIHVSTNNFVLVLFFCCWLIFSWVVVWCGWPRLVDFFRFRPVSHRWTGWLFQTICCVCTLHAHTHTRSGWEKQSLHEKVSSALSNCWMTNLGSRTYLINYGWWYLRFYSRNCCHIMKYARHLGTFIYVFIVSALDKEH